MVDVFVQNSCFERGLNRLTVDLERASDREGLAFAVALNHGPRAGNAQQRPATVADAVARRCRERLII